MEKQIITVTAKRSGKEFDIDWGVIRRGIETLQKLAPMGLRTPPEFLDDLYECKRTLKSIYEIEETLINQEFDALLKVDSQDDDMGKRF